MLEPHNQILILSMAKMPQSKKMRLLNSIDKHLMCIFKDSFGQNSQKFQVSFPRDKTLVPLLCYAFFLGPSPLFIYP